ncbi:MAG TPA: C40 family peptidase [Desulfovibrio sp.]|uniref:C40 family peptidase n=1 Tax=Desulfovibrio TaxID=872 RepID=UPI000414F4D1|nr:MULTISPECIES: C40 family peptidase [Desulfovibrio]MDY0306298.1 C40 family peptidase [Desulfovibrionaceae bacterium]HMM39858.1 C40 family peptidase [Desulfovibrio sp.]
MARFPVRFSPRRDLTRVGFLVLALPLALLLAGCSGLEPMRSLPSAPVCRPTSTEPCPPPEGTARKTSASTAPGSELVLTARTMMGTRYKYGGIAPQSGFDCSGFTRWVFEQHGLDLPRSSVEQFEMGKPVGFESLKPGDLVFFRIRRRNQGLHVGIVTGPGTFIHSPNRGDRVREESFLQPYWVGRYIGARRVLN